MGREKKKKRKIYCKGQYPKQFNTHTGLRWDVDAAIKAETVALQALCSAVDCSCLDVMLLRLTPVL